MNATLLVIDVQNEYFAPDGKLQLPDAAAALPNIHRLLAAARGAGMPIVHVVHESLDPNAERFRCGSDGVRIHPSIHVEPGESVIVKHVPGSFTGTPLDQLLRRHGTHGVLVCGYMTQQCCEMTTRQAYERGMPVVFAADATAARALTIGARTYSHTEIHEATLAVLTQYATVLSTEEIVAALAAARTSAP
jgi:nicotinamidase-related amidase